MTECQGCGAWNERHRTLCVLCGTPLAETDEWDAAAELPPLPPLPDGGLSVSMPAWLRAAPDDPEPLDPKPLASSSAATVDLDVELVAAVPDHAVPVEVADTEAVADLQETAPEDAVPAEPPLGPHADPRTFLRDEDFPRWIRELPALPPRREPPVTVIAPQATDPAPLVASAETRAPLPPPLPEPVPSAQAGIGTGPLTATEATEPAPAPASAAAPATKTSVTKRQREPWETPLLVVLVVGIIMAVIWALLVNGLIGNVL